MRDIYFMEGFYLAKMNMKLIIGFLMVLVLIAPESGKAIASTNQVLIEPPPDMSPFTIFDPNYQYLEDGFGGLSHLGGGKVNVWGHSFGTINVDVIGVQVTLQRWNGTAWVDVSAGSNVTATNDSYAYSSRNTSVSTGYYYRVKTKHWIEYGKVKEDGTRYSSSLLVVD